MKPSHYAFLIAIIQATQSMEAWVARLGSFIWLFAAVVCWLSERGK